MANHLLNVFYGVRDGAAFSRGVQAALDQMAPDGIFTGDNLIAFGRNLSFLGDPAFMEAMQRNAETAYEKAAIWRSYVLCWAARRALRLDGDFAECGCYKGISARIVVDAIGFGATERHFYLYDLFEHSSDMNHHAMLEHSGNLYDTVCRRFADLPRVHVIKGAVPDSFSQGVPKKIAFLHVDMNNAEAELGALDALFDRAVPGASIVFDDYGWTGYAKQKAAEDRFFAARGYQILELPTGQGLLIV